MVSYMYTHVYIYVQIVLHPSISSAYYKEAVFNVVQIIAGSNTFHFIYISVLLISIV